MISVKCPICGAIKKVRNSQRFFRHCGMLFEVEKYKIVSGVSMSITKDKTKNYSDEIEIELEDAHG